MPTGKLRALRNHGGILRIFSNTISPEIFPGTFPKNLSGTRDEHTVRDFPKMPHRTFRQIPASSPHLMLPTLKTGSKKQPFLSFRHSPAHPANDRPSKSAY
jgi:hypothetical protein